MMQTPSRRTRRISVRCVHAVVIVLALVLALGWDRAYAQFSTKAAYAILIDAGTGSVLYQKDADVLMAPASMSKLVTVGVIFKALKDGQLKLTDEFVVSENAWRTGGAPSGTSAMFVPINTKEPVSELLRGIIIQSGNDAAIAVAEGMAGSEQAFAKRMTEYMRVLGFKKSTFGNATGLPHPQQQMTARELAQLARHLITAYPEYYSIFGEREFKYRKHRFFNRNPLLALNAGYDGLKTGHTNESGHGIVASAQRDGRRLIAVLNGLSSNAERKTETEKLVDWGFKSFGMAKLFDAGEVVGSARVWGGSSYYVPLVGQGDINVLVPNFLQKARFDATVVYQGPLKPPVRRGDQVATLRVTFPNGTVSEAPLYAGADVAPASVWMQGLDTLAYMAFGWIPL